VTLADFQPQIESALSAAVTFREVRHGQVQVYVPFTFPDGDGFVVHLRQVGERLEISDQANTLLHLSYHTDVDRLFDGPRGSLLERILLRGSLEERDGEFVARTSPETLGVDIFRFVQALLEISDLRNLDRETVRSTFRDDLRQLITGHFPTVELAHVDREHDTDGRYPIPYLLNGVTRPIAIFDVNSDERALEALVIVDRFRQWGRSLHTVAIEQDQASLTRQHVAWLSKDIDKQYPALSGSEREIVDYIGDQHHLSRRLDQT
jgi:hypothetical protein